MYRTVMKYFEGWTTWAKRVFSKQYTFPCYRASQSSGSTRRSPFTTRVKPSIKHIVISVYLNAVCYLISYTRFFTYLNLFKILLSVTFLTTKFSKSTVYIVNNRNLMVLSKYSITYLKLKWYMCVTCHGGDGTISTHTCVYFK